MGVDERNNIFSNPYLKMAGLGAARSVFGFPLEAPLYAMKYRAQLNPHLNTRHVVQSLCQEYGLSGLFNLGAISITRRLTKEVVRTPTILLIHEKVASLLPTSLSQQKSIQEISTAVTIATFDTIVFLPLDQLSGYKAKKSLSYTSFFQDRFVGHGISVLYRGWPIHIVQHGFIWTIALVGNIKATAYTQNIEVLSSRPFLQKTVSSLCIATVATATCLPLDFLKTHIQTEDKLTNMSIKQAVKQLHADYKIKGFYAGKVPVFLHTFLYSIYIGVIASYFQPSKQAS